MVLLDNNKKKKTSRKQKRHSLKDCIEQFFNFSDKNVIHDKIILFDAGIISIKKHDVGGLC